MRASFSFAIILTVLLAACEVDQQDVERARATAEAGGEKVATEIEERFGNQWGVRFEYPVLNDPRDKETADVVDSTDRGLDGWEVLQEFGEENDWFSTCATVSGCVHAGVDLRVNNDATGAHTVGQSVYAIGDGTIIDLHDTGSYPGDAVLIEHETDDGPLYSMYAHIDREVSLTEGQAVDASTKLGTIVRWPYDPGSGNSHLHLEIRTFGEAGFVMHNDIFECGCVVGPGYWLESWGGVSRPDADNPSFYWLDALDVIEESRR